MFKHNVSVSVLLKAEAFHNLTYARRARTKTLIKAYKAIEVCLNREKGVILCLQVKKKLWINEMIKMRIQQTGTERLAIDQKKQQGLLYAKTGSEFY